MSPSKKARPTQTSFRLDDTLLHRLDAVAVKMKLSRADIIRMAIERGLGVVESTFDRFDVVPNATPTTDNDV